MSETTPDPNGSADWLRNQGYAMTPLGESVAHILGRVYMGIYNAPIKWRNPEVQARWHQYRDCIEVVVGSPLCTTDFDQLTRLVVLCHDLHVRCEIEGASWRYTRLTFSLRLRTGDTYRAHPTIEQAIEKIRHGTPWQTPMPKEGGAK